MSDVLLRALALALDMPEATLLDAHDPAAPDVQTALRLLHYPPLAHRTDVDVAGSDRWRAGAHTDFDVLTLLFQGPGEGGLEVCPGRAASTEFACGDVWLPVPPQPGCITCNIGDMLMRWSDDRVVSTFHRGGCAFFFLVSTPMRARAAYLRRLRAFPRPRPHGAGPRTRGGWCMVR